MPNLRRCLAALMVILAPALATAQAITGSEGSAFRSAVAAWLAGEDDAASLGALADLARSGNPSAQILLAQIATRANMHLHVTSGLPRKERLALLRQPGGLSGRSWLEAAKGSEPLAAALLQSTRIGEKAAAVAALIEMGEPSEALLAAQSLVFQGEGAALLSALSGVSRTLPPELAALLPAAQAQAESENGGGYPGSARVPGMGSTPGPRAALDLAWIGPNPRNLVEQPALREAVTRYYRDVPSWTPMARFCEAECPETTAACVAVGMSTLWAGGPFALRSPLQSVIPDRTYWESPRITGDLARLTPSVGGWNTTGPFHQIDACFFDAMAAAQAVHGHAN